MDRLEMAEKIHVCAGVKYQRSAGVFGFVEGKGELPVCPEHLSTFSSRDYPYSI